MGAVLALYLAVPVAAFLYRALGSTNRGFGAAGLWPALSVSLQGATISLVLVTVLGVPLAYVLAHHPGRVATAVAVVVQLPLALPPLMSGILLIYLVGPYSFLGRHFGGRLSDTLTGVVIAQSFVSAPFLVISARSALAAVDPALGAVAATLGHRPLARFFRVDLPGAAAGIRAGMVLTWLRAFGEYGATLIIAYHPFSLPIYLDNQFSGYPLSTTEAPTLIALGVAVVAIVVGQASLRRRRRSVVLPPGRPPVGHPPTAVDFDLDVHVGSFHLAVTHAGSGPRLAVVGPSGSGKTITLRALAGLLGPDAGRVRFGGVDVTRITPEHRRVGYVPQGYGLLPGRTVWQQVLFGVHADPALASWWLHTLHLEELVDRRPEELSGGQRQRVSLARALATAPDVVLLDEPFSSLDAPVRAELRRELRRLQQQTGLSTILVTHDPEEAAVLADEILVVSDGGVLQAGPTGEVFRRPATAAVGRLLGVSNLTPGIVGDEGTRPGGGGRSNHGVPAGGVLPPAAVPDAGLPFAAVALAAAGLTRGAAFLWHVPPPRIRVRAGDPAGGEVLAAVAIDVIDLGTVVEVIVLLDDGPELVARVDAPSRLRPGQRVAVGFDPADVTVWETDSPPDVSSPPTS